MFRQPDTYASFGRNRITSEPIQYSVRDLTILRRCSRNAVKW